MATFTWVISTLERDLLPEDMNGAAAQSDGVPWTQAS